MGFGSSICGGVSNFIFGNLSFIGGGSNNYASGLSSAILFGRELNTNFKGGTVMLGDYGGAASSGVLMADAHDQFMTRFRGGYKFYTNQNSTSGAILAANANSWSSVSDSTKKEKFKSADAEAVLKSFRNLRLGSWNYKAQSKEQFRHYGPMAQEWHAAFGRDGVGTIGCDTLLASADVDGIAYIAIKGLEQRTAEQAATIAALYDKNILQDELIQQLKQEMGQIRTELASTRQLNEAMVKRFEELNSKISSILNMNSGKTANRVK